MPLINLALFLSACAAESNAPQLPVWTAGIELRTEKQKHRVFITPDMHDLVVLVAADDSQSLVPVTGTLNNSLVPTVRVAITPPGGAAARYRYAYTVTNGKTARDNITYVNLAAPTFLPGTEASYYLEGHNSDFWLGMVSSVVVGRQSELDGSFGKQIGWASADDPDPNAESVNILPGRTKTGFVADSALMPGFTTASVQGLYYVPPEDVDEEALREFGEYQLDNYAKVTVLTFGPMFLPGSEPVEVLKNYRLGLQRLARCGAIPHSAAFTDEVAGILSEPGIEARLAGTLAQMKEKPATPIETELLDCLRIVAAAFTNRQHRGSN